MNSLIRRKVKNIQDRMLEHDTIWSTLDNEIIITSTVTDKDFPNVIVNDVIPEDAVVVRAEVLIKFRMLENTANDGVNFISGSQTIRVKKSTGTWGADDMVAINLPNESWELASSTRERGDIIFGGIDVKSVVDSNGTYNIKLSGSQSTRNNLELRDVQSGILINWR